MQRKNINRQTELILEKIWWLSDGEEKIKGGLMRAAGTRLDILIHELKYEIFHYFTYAN